MALVYVAGMERGDVLMGDWSTMMILSICPFPFISLNPSLASPRHPL
jgi:hypothetical protein